MNLILIKLIITYNVLFISFLTGVNGNYFNTLVLYTTTFLYSLLFLLVWWWGDRASLKFISFRFQREYNSYKTGFIRFYKIYNNLEEVRISKTKSAF